MSRYLWSVAAVADAAIVSVTDGIGVVGVVVLVVKDKSYSGVKSIDDLERKLALETQCAKMSTGSVVTKNLRRNLQVQYPKFACKTNSVVYAW